VSEPAGSEKDVRSDEPVNDKRAELYERLFAAQELIAHAQYRRGVEHEVVLAALDAVDERMSDEDRREDLYLAALRHYVEALGGRVEVRAVFGDETIVVPGS
jgi:hypothetical protein